MVSGGLGRASRRHTAQIGWLGGSCVGEGPSASRGHSFITLLCALRLRGYTGGYKGGGSAEGKHFWIDLWGSELRPETSRHLTNMYLNYSDPQEGPGMRYGISGFDLETP